MQDRFVGDVGDFGKYILLNKVYEQFNVRITLGINWFRTKQETYSYLCEKEGNDYQKCGKSVYDQLKTLYVSRSVTIKAVQKAGILPEGTIFYRDYLPHRGGSAKRDDWFKKSLEELGPADVLFLDPDNGVRPDETGLGKKHVCVKEIKQCYGQGKSVIVYQHSIRKSRAEHEGAMREIGKRVDSCSNFRILRFKRKPVRYYLFFMREDHSQFINEAIQCLSQRLPYNSLFEPVDG